MNRLARILPFVACVLFLALIPGCASEVTAPEAPEVAAAVAAPELTPCKPLPATFASGWIGPKGGVLKAGSHSLKVPPGALSTNVFVTLEAPSSAVNKVGLEPVGLKFEPGTAAYLSVSYENCTIPPGTAQQVVRVSSRLKVLQVLPSLMDPATLSVEGKVQTFSDYALSTYAVVY